MEPKTAKTLVFTVRRSEPELIAPAKQTPYEYKLLSDIDDQESLRFQAPMISFYEYNPIMAGKDPAKVIKEAIAKTLVHYYPLAGRLRECRDDRKLVVDCTGEGILFIEADADVSLKEFGEYLHPPFPCIDELLYDVHGTTHVLNTPLMLIQVTRLKCNGFIFAIRFNHTISDAMGLVQFLNAVGEIANGALAPSILPIWERHLLNARNPPHITCTHHEYDDIQDTKETIIIHDEMVHRSFFFGPNEIFAIRRLLPKIQKTTTFELLTATLWRCRTIALKPNPNEEMRMICVVNTRLKLKSFIPLGYYGNAFAFSTVISKAKKLVENPLGYTLNLIKNAKENVNEEYMKSVADLMVLYGRPNINLVQSFLISDITRVKFEQVDFGWGKAVYGGTTRSGMGDTPDVTCFFVPFKNKDGENGVLVPMCLPSHAMEIFVNELNDMLHEKPHQPNIEEDSSLIV